MWLQLHKFSAMAAREQKAFMAASHLIQSHSLGVQPMYASIAFVVKVSLTTQRSFHPHFPVFSWLTVPFLGCLYIHPSACLSIYRLGNLRSGSRPVCLYLISVAFSPRLGHRWSSFLFSVSLWLTAVISSNEQLSDCSSTAADIQREHCLLYFVLHQLLPSLIYPALIIHRDYWLGAGIYLPADSLRFVLQFSLTLPLSIPPAAWALRSLSLFGFRHNHYVSGVK